MLDILPITSIITHGKYKSPEEYRYIIKDHLREIILVVCLYA